MFSGGAEVPVPVTTAAEEFGVPGSTLYRNASASPA